MRPNVLWLMSDQHNASVLGCAGHPDARTPHLDAIAADGVRFDSAFCNNPICAPSRACFISGEYVHSHGITGNRVYENVTSHPHTVARHFREHGYQTALIGKGHLPRTWLEDGFEDRRYCDLADGEPNDPCSVAYFQHLVDQGLGDAYDLGTLPPQHPGADMSAFVSEIPTAHAVETWTGDQALDFLTRGRDAARPFFVQLSFQRPHDPLTHPADAEERSDPAALTLPENAADYFIRQFSGKPRQQREFVSSGRHGYPYRPVDEADLRQQVAAYYDLVSAIDEQIGRVVSYLRQTGEWENTIVVYHSDHGDFAGEHGLVFKNLGIYESIHRIPFLVRWPGGPTGVACAELVESVDLYPTLCELAGLGVPPHVEGRSLLDVVGGRVTGKPSVVCEWDNPRFGSVFALRTRDQRLVYYAADPADGELYDRRTDPGELDNLYRSRECQETRADLLAQLLAHVGAFHRTWTPSDDATTAHHGLTHLLHKRHVKWSDIASLVERR